MLLKTKERSNRRDELRIRTAAKFDGGLNLIDNDLSIDSKFAKRLINLIRDEDGSLGIRHGTQLFADLEADFQFTRIVDATYFERQIISVNEDGRIAATNGAGASAIIWNNTIAARLPGTPSGWGTTPRASFAEFRGHLVIANGYNKPLDITSAITCSYLVDAATGSNAFVPIARYVAVHGEYLIMAGDILDPSMLYIGARGTIGTFEGAPAPNDGVNVDMSVYIYTNSEITGLGSYRERLAVLFTDAIVTGQLGIYDGTTHEPDFDDPIPSVGTVQHQTVRFLGDELVFLDAGGVSKITRAFLNTQLQAGDFSQLIAPRLINALDLLDYTTREEAIFTLYDRVEQLFYVFIPNSDGRRQTCFVLKYIPALKIAAWSEITGWSFQCGLQSLEGRVFFCRDGKIFLLGNENDPTYRDFIDEQEAWTDSTNFDDQTGWTPISTLADPNTNGIGIPFDWTLPWTSLSNRMLQKQLKYVQLDTQGTSEFTLQLFVDNIFELRSDTGEPWSDGDLFSDGLGWIRETPAVDPALSMQFIAGEAINALAVQGQTLLNTVRRDTSDERLYKLPLKCKLLRLRFLGTARRKLRFNTISVSYLQGSIGR